MMSFKTNLITSLRHNPLARRIITSEVLTAWPNVGSFQARHLSSNIALSSLSHRSLYSRVSQLSSYTYLQRHFSDCSATKDQITTQPKSNSVGVVIPEDLSLAEKEIYTILAHEFEPKFLKVQDISGGCGSMYEIHVISERFQGLRVLQQQRLVNSVLGDMLKKWHGVRLTTSEPVK